MKLYQLLTMREWRWIDLVKIAMNLWDLARSYEREIVHGLEQEAIDVVRGTVSIIAPQRVK
jgi:hypothetical protein